MGWRVSSRIPNSEISSQLGNREFADMWLLTLGGKRSTGLFMSLKNYVARSLDKATHSSHGYCCTRWTCGRRPWHPIGFDACLLETAYYRGHVCRINIVDKGMFCIRIYNFWCNHHVKCHLCNIERFILNWPLTWNKIKPFNDNNNMVMWISNIDMNIT